MLEVRATPARVIRCLAGHDSLAAVKPLRAIACRLASDDLMLVAIDDDGDDDIISTVSAQLAAADPCALVLDQTDGFSLVGLRGQGARIAFARLSALRMPATPPGFVQGAVAGVPAKVLFISEERIEILVSSPLGHHVLDRARTDCRDLSVKESG